MRSEIPDGLDVARGLREGGRVETIDRHELTRLVEAGAQLVETLGREEFEDEHLIGAINIPLRRIDAEARDRLDPGKPVIAYCWDSA